MSDLSNQIGSFIDKQEQQKREREEALQANRARIVPFLENVVLPAFAELKTAFEQQGRIAEVSSYVAPSDGASASLKISKKIKHKSLPESTSLEMRYTIEFGVSESHVTPRVKTWDGKYSGESLIRGRSPDDVENISVKDIQDDVLRNWQHLALMREI